MYHGDHVRDLYTLVQRWIDETGFETLYTRRAEAETLFRKIGITFAVYGEDGDPERLIPFDLIPRVFGAAEWSHIEAGVIQRSRALNAFLSDIYSEAEIVKAGVIPQDIAFGNAAFEPVMRDIRPPRGVFSHVIGVDVVRVGPDDYYILEDNCRTPSGISYVLENREIMSRMFPALISEAGVRPVDDYPFLLRRVLSDMAPRTCKGEPRSVVLTPGYMNSAYYEHSFLADEMGVELVEGPDLFVQDDVVYMRTTMGAQRVDVIYRRIDDDYLDPGHFRPDSVLGVYGLIDAYRAGNVTLVNAPGTGVADDKAMYTYVPDMIRFYLGEEPILNNVPTWRCRQEDDLAYVLENLPDLVVKEVHGSGGYGMLIGPKSTRAEQEEFRKRIKAKPSNYIAQPTLSLSACPCLVEEGVAPRHVDFRPFVLTGARTEVIPGGLTRVALRAGSLVVNSSQGGGVKDTWVLHGEV
ncbi:MAG: circularly permuted type 2 ATP-grasp protein [Alphaproteobacteria bacterium]